MKQFYLDFRHVWQYMEIKDLDYFYSLHLLMTLSSDLLKSWLIFTPSGVCRRKFLPPHWRCANCLQSHDWWGFIHETASSMLIYKFLSCSTEGCHRANTGLVHGLSSPTTATNEPLDTDFFVTLACQCESWNYRAVGGINHNLSKTTRPDIAFAIHQCA